MRSFPATETTASDLRARLDGTTPTFVLIDPMLGEPLPGFVAYTDSAEAQSAREAAWQRHVTRIPLAARVTLPEHQHPYIVALTGPDDALFDDTFAIANFERMAAQEDGLNADGCAPHRIGGWLQSTMHPEDLAAHLSTIFRVNTDAFTKATYMRLVDRRALALLRHVVGDVRICAQFGRLQRWVYVDALGGLSTLASASESVEPLRLSVGEWKSMEQGAAIHRTTAQWLGELASAGQTLQRTPHDIYDAVQLAIEEAGHAAKQWPHRFSELTDNTAYAATCLLHPGVSAIKTVRALLDQPGTADNPPEPMRYMHPEVRQLAIADFESRRA
jgi:hypothetical protein